MDDQIAVRDLFERGPERRDQSFRQVADEPHSVIDDHLLIVRQTQPPRCRIERGEHLFLSVNLALRECVEQRRLAGVRVADERNDRKIFLYAVLSAFLPLMTETFDLSLEL